jgi:heterodisulfide reductase subunit B
MGLDVCAPCSACFTILSKVNRHMRWGEERKAQINEVLAAAGLSYSAEREVLHPLQILARKYGVPAIAGRVVQPLTGVRVAPYYGCQIVRPLGRFDDTEDPVTLDDLFRGVGAEVVPFSAKVRCCGGMLMTFQEDVALGLSRDILAEAAERGADVVVTTCPLCQMNLEVFQRRINESFGTAFDLPIVFFTQLLGLALGFTAEEMQLDRILAGAGRLEACLRQVPA